MLGTGNFVLLSALVIVGAVSAGARTRHDSFYTAAVYEHRLLGEDGGGVRANLGYYERAAELARQQGADIILFPEYGLVPPTNNRSEIRKHLEIVPNPKQTTVNPCQEAELFEDRPILQALSCMARENDIVVVANMGGLEPCVDDPSCPADGVLQLNTNVAFDSNGTLLARYYKEHLYYELSMDLPREDQDPVFETEFGVFAMSICFDLLFEKIAITSRLPEVDAVLFSTMWFNSLPLFASTQWFQSWSMGNNATLIASNIQVPGHALSGSGIFQGRRGPVVLTQNPDGISKLLVATLSKHNQDFPSRTQRTAIFKNGTGEVRKDGTDVPVECSFKRLGETEDLDGQFRCINEDISNYTLVKLKGTEGRIRVCHNGMCCEVVYAAASMDETFYVGVSNATNNSSGRYQLAEENCFLARCEDVGNKLCSYFPTKSETVFHEVIMTANFTTDYVYPSFVSNELKLLPVQNWTFGSKHNVSTITMSSDQGVTLIAATLKGRVYHRDPPYVR